MTLDSVFGRKTVLTVSFVVLAGVFAASVGYRMLNPKLEKRMERRGGMAPGMTAGMPAEDMAGLKATMKLLEEEPENFKALKELGSAFMMMQAWERAVPFLERANKVRPDDREVLMSLGIVRFQQKRYHDAAAVYEGLLEKHPQDALVNFNLGIIYKHFLDKPDAAADLFRTAIQNAGDDKDMVERATKELESIGH
ncbi:tetratricopeptide repeat protein [Desulfovibrio oxyclinae]|jgi:tetratricopeptide (TPR) repeat protein|uniref:tetratricopeptide repeat protein n=1 Tax=Desulfovibrio oxyclinae TaxID=63560 RepID=UPI00035C26EF|nr:tetratricopeptide repeat protein [Desulfovibrio oxyclinae]